MAFAIDNKKIARNTVALYIRMAVTMAIGFFTARVTLQQLGVEDYGLNNLVGSIVSMFSFINGSMGTAVQRFYSIELGQGNENHLKRVFGTGLYLHIWVAIITIILAEIFAFFFLHKMNIPENRQFAAQVVFQISIFSLALSIVNVPYAALLRAREMFDKVAIVEIIQSFLRLGILYLLIIIDYDKIIVLSILGFVVTLYYVSTLTFFARKFKETHSRPIRDKELIKEMLSFIAFLLVTVLSSLAKTQGLIILINIFFGLAINAAYAVAVQVSHMVNNFAQSFKQSMIPQMMAACGAKDYKAMHKIINIGTKITFLLLMMITVPIIFETNFFLTLWLKNPPEYSSKLVSLVLIYVNIASFTYFQYQGVHATGTIRAQQVWMCLLYAINVLLIYVVFKLGASFEAALYVNIIISIIQCLVNLIYSRMHYFYSLRTFITNILFPCFLLIIVVGVMDYLVINMMDVSITRFFVVLLVSECSLILFGYYLLLDKKEKESVCDFVKKLTRR